MNDDDRHQDPNPSPLELKTQNSKLKTVISKHPQELVLCGLVVLEWLWFRLVGTRFGTLENSYDLLRHSVEIGLLALVMTPVILTGGIDLSVGSLLGLCAIVYGKAWRDAHLPITVAALMAIGAGALGGALN